MLHGPRGPDGLVAAQDHERWKAALVRALRIREAVLDRMLRGEEGDDALARHVAPQVRHEMTEVVLLLRAHRAVGEEHERALAREASDGGIRVDPRIHPLAPLELRARRAELGSDDGGAGLKCGEDVGGGRQTRAVPTGACDTASRPRRSGTGPSGALEGGWMR